MTKIDNSWILPYRGPMATDSDKPTSMHVSLPAAMKRFVDERVTSGGFGSVSDYVRALVRADMKVQAREALERRLLEALETPSGEMKAEHWQELREEVVRRHAKKRDAS